MKRELIISTLNPLGHSMGGVIVKKIDDQNYISTLTRNNLKEMSEGNLFVTLRDDVCSFVQYFDGSFMCSNHLNELGLLK